MSVRGERFHTLIKNSLFLSPTFAGSHIDKQHWSTQRGYLRIDETLVQQELQLLLQNRTMKRVGLILTSRQAKQQPSSGAICHKRPNIKELYDATEEDDVSSNTPYNV